MTLGQTQIFGPGNKGFNVILHPRATKFGNGNELLPRSQTTLVPNFLSQ